MNTYIISQIKKYREAHLTSVNFITNKNCRLLPNVNLQLQPKFYTRKHTTIYS